MADKIIADKNSTENGAAAAPSPAPVSAAPKVAVSAAPAVVPTPEVTAKPVETVAAAKPAIVAAKVPEKTVPKAAAPTPVATPKAAAPAPAAPKVAAPKVAAPKAVAAKPVTRPAAKVAVKAPAKKIVSVPTKSKPVAAPAAKTITINKELTMEKTIKNTTDKAQAMFVDMNDRAKAALEKTQGMFSDVTEFNKGNVEALVESSKIAAKGIETMGQDAAEYTRKSFENMTAIVKSLSAVKSPTEFMKLHSDYVRTSFDSLVAESSKTTETMLKLAGEIAQPISNRVAIAAEKIKISA